MGNPMELTGHKNDFLRDDSSERHNQQNLSVCSHLAAQKQYGRSTTRQTYDNGDL
jgi:hypothetical protein